MSDKSSIEWTDATWNPTRGCTKIAQGCKRCYAERFAERFRGVAGHPYELGFDPRIAPDKLAEPLTWKTSRRIFVDSMSDLFHEAFPDEYIAAAFGVMYAACWHTFQILTKRAERAAALMPDLSSHDCVRAAQKYGVEIGHPGAFYRGKIVDRSLPLPNVWIGTSIAEQKDADANIPHLLKIPAAVRFLSAEPLIGPIEFSKVTRRADAIAQLGRPALAGIDWLIVGGESGPGARPCDLEWIRSIVEQCKAVGVPVFVKQLGAKPYMSLRQFHNEQYPPCGPLDLPVTYLWPRDTKWRTCDGKAEPLLHNRKGGDWNEWPADLRIRQFPAEVPHVA